MLCEPQIGNQTGSRATFWSRKITKIAKKWKKTKDYDRADKVAERGSQAKKKVPALFLEIKVWENIAIEQNANLSSFHYFFKVMTGFFHKTQQKTVKF